MSGCMGGGKPLVSIIVPVYRTEEYLPQCIESLLAQRHQNIEILLIDDGSPDRCGLLCDRYAERDGRVVVMHQRNRGVSAARNAGVQAAKGAYIAFVDSDDWVGETYIESLLHMAVQNHADAAVALERTKRTYLWTGREALHQLCYQKWFDTAPWGKLFRTELVREIPFPEGMFFEDLAVVCRMIGGAERVAAGPGPEYHYRDNPTGTMHGGEVSRLLDELRAADQMYDYAKSILDCTDKAAENRKFSAYCQVLMKLPEDGYGEVRTRIWSYLRQVRGRIFWDREARGKNRIAALAACFGEPLMRRLWGVTR